MLNILIYSKDAFITLVLTKKKNVSADRSGIIQTNTFIYFFPNLLAGMSAFVNKLLGLVMFVQR